MVRCKQCGTDYKVSCYICYPAPTKEEEKRIQRFEETFRHYHVNNGVDDFCKQCGPDLRDLIHRLPAI